MRKKIAVLILLLANVPQALAQSSLSDSEAKKRKEEITKKALILVDLAVDSAQSLKLPENRIRIQIGAADILWQRDEKRARTLFKNATDALGELQAAEREQDPRHNQGEQLSIQIRHEMLGVVAKHDPALAVQFVRASRQPSREPAGYYDQPDPEVNLEFKLAQRIAEKDPAEGLRIAQEALTRGIDHDVINLLYQLQSQKKELAASLCASIIKRLRSEDISKSQVSSSIALTLLRMGAEPINNSPDILVREQGTYLNGQARDLFQARDLAELAGIVARYAQKVVAGQSDGYSGVSIANMVRPVLAEIEKYAPVQAQSLRESFAEYDRFNRANVPLSNRLYEQMQNNTTEGLLELAKEAPPEMQNNIYQNAAWRLFSEGKIEQAQQVVIEKISNPATRADMLEQFERQRLIQESSAGKIDEALERASRIRSVPERVDALINIAATAISAGDKKKGLQVLGEARSLISGRAQNYSQLSSQLQLARAYLPHEAQISFSIIEPVIGQLNNLISASSVLSGFDMPEYFKDGEMMLRMGSTLINYVQEYSQILGELARSNFDPAKSLADSFQQDEVRALGYILMAQSFIKEVEVSTPSEGMTILPLPRLTLVRAR
ncbi:MAG TPA: hypothetical protein VIG62_02740 [Blastocatellia bacterium]|jgi:hypothetical protein